MKYKRQAERKALFPDLVTGGERLWRCTALLPVLMRFERQDPREAGASSPSQRVERVTRICSSRIGGVAGTGRRMTLDTILTYRHLHTAPRQAAVGIVCGSEAFGGGTKQLHPN